MFSRTLEYALRAAVFLAGVYGKPKTAQQIADATAVPLSYLPKVLQQLVRADLAIGTRGLHGGYVLRRPPADISILDVVNAIEPVCRVETCPLRLSAHADGHLCPLHRRIDAVLAQAEHTFACTTLAEILAEPGLPDAWVCRANDLSAAMHPHANGNGHGNGHGHSHQHVVKT
jgi:Rrf2 family transcriptional regulator, nitric oxide-sensitive transcriptional repressor